MYHLSPKAPLAQTHIPTQLSDTYLHKRNRVRGSGPRWGWWAGDIIHMSQQVILSVCVWRERGLQKSVCMCVSCRWEGLLQEDFEVFWFFVPPAYFSFLHSLSSKLSIYHSLGLHLLCVIRLKVILTGLRMVWTVEKLKFWRLSKLSSQTLMPITKVDVWVFTAK